jgi:hypothetical protein
MRAQLTPGPCLVAVSLTAALASVACGGNASSSPAKASVHGEDSGAEPTDSGSVPAPPGLSLTWRIVESGAVGVPADAGLSGTVSVASLPGIAGVRVCAYQKPEIPCATSDADGVFVVRGLSSVQHVVLTTEKSGYVKTIRPIETASTDMDNTAAPLVTSKVDAPRPDLGIPYDATKGAVSFFALAVLSDGGLGLPSGVGVTLAPKTAEGPFFTTRDNAFDRSAQTTVGGLGFYFNVTPGDYELTFEDAVANCAPISFPLGAWGFPAPPTSVRFPVLAGYVTDQVGVLCTQKSVLGPDAATP